MYEVLTTELLVDVIFFTHFPFYNEIKINKKLLIIIIIFINYYNNNICDVECEKGSSHTIQHFEI